MEVEVLQESPIASLFGADDGEDSGEDEVNTAASSPLRLCGGGLRGVVTPLNALEYLLMERLAGQAAASLLLFHFAFCTAVTKEKRRGKEKKELQVRRRIGNISINVWMYFTLS